MLIVIINANYLKEDPVLGEGWAHWVESEPFQEYVDLYGLQYKVGNL